MAELNFDVQKSNAYKQSNWVNLYNKGFLVKFFKFLAKYVFPISLIFWVSIIVLELFFGIFFDPLIKVGLGFVLSFSGLSLWILWFWHDGLVEAKTTLTIDEARSLGQEINLAECLDPSAVELLERAYKHAYQGGYDILDPVFLFLALSETEIGNYIFVRMGIYPKLVMDIQIKPIMDKISKSGAKTIELSEELSAILIESLNIALSVTDLKGKEMIDAGDIIVASFKKSKFFIDLLVRYELKIEDVENIVNWYYLQQRFYIKKPFWDPSTVISGIGDEWAFGYTNMLGQFGTDWTKQIAYVFGRIHIYGRTNEIAETERVLARGEKNNVLLVGDPGVGKESIVNGLIIKMIEKNTLPELNYKKVYKIDVGALLSGVGQKGEVEARISAILNEALIAGNIILFIEDIHNIFSAEEYTGAVNASSIILPYLRESGLQIIGTTDLENYHKNIEANPGVADVFEKIEVKEPPKETTVSILESTIPQIEYKNQVIFIYSTIKEALNVAERYIYDKPFPAKVIDLVDDVATNVRKNKGANALVEKSDIDEIISQKSNVPVGQVGESEKEKLLNLEQLLHERVIGQDEAIKVIADAMRRARSGLNEGKRPVGTFLFLGPTGVGKTETARALAESYFSSEKNMIRIDMSEFQEQSSIYRLIGAPPAAGKEGTQGQLTKAVKDNPFSLILLDELEKAHPDILNLFLQVFDDGRLTDGTGKTVNFTNAIIIATSNAGSELIREEVKNSSVDSENLKEKLLEYLQEKGIFKPEFLNRFDAIVAFKPLTKDQLHQIVDLMVIGLNKTLLDKDVEVELSPEASDKLIEIGFDPVFGARPLRRALQDKVENLVAERLLQGQIEQGQKIVINKDDIK